MQLTNKKKINTTKAKKCKRPLKYVGGVSFGQDFSLGSQARPGWNTCPSLARPAALLLCKLYLNQASLSRATCAAGRCADSLFP